MVTVLTRRNELPKRRKTLYFYLDTPYVPDLKKFIKKKLLMRTMNFIKDTFPFREKNTIIKTVISNAAVKKKEHIPYITIE